MNTSVTVMKTKPSSNELNAEVREVCRQIRSYSLYLLDLDEQKLNEDETPLNSKTPRVVKGVKKTEKDSVSE